MCDPDMCLADPARSCQATGDERLSYVWPQMSSALSGDLLLGRQVERECSAPARRTEGTAVLRSHGDVRRGRRPLLDRVRVGRAHREGGVLYRHRSGEDAVRRYLEEASTQRHPRGRAALRMAGVDQPDHRRSMRDRTQPVEPTVQLRGIYPEVVASEAANPPRYGNFRPGPSARNGPPPRSGGRRHGEARPRSRESGHVCACQAAEGPGLPCRDRPDTGRPIGWIWPILVKPHPFLAAAAQNPLRTVAAEAKKISAHYRFFSYSDATIAVKPAFDAPPPARGDACGG